MRWLSQISFSNHHHHHHHRNDHNYNDDINKPSWSLVSNSALATASSPSSPAAPSGSGVDSGLSVKNNHWRYLHGAGSFRLRFNIGGSRQRKLRCVAENDVASQHDKLSPAAVVKSSSSSADLQKVSLSRSPSGSSSAALQHRSSSSVVPVPLPLPLPVHSGDGDSRLPWQKERDERDGVSSRERDDKDRNDCVNGDEFSSSNFKISSVHIGRERRKIIEPLDIRSPRKVQSIFTVDNYGENFRINAPIRSAPPSPEVSKQRSSPSADWSLYYQMIAKGNQVWSAPEMTAMDITGFPPPAFFDLTAFSSDNSPLHSPPSKSPHQHPRSPTGPPSPLNAKLSVETLANFEVHPLPLPPGASRASMSSLVVPQVIAKAESKPLKSRWQKGKLIGRGTFGSVYVASNMETGALCAMKEVDIFPDDPKSAESIKQLEQEIKVLSQLKHPNIVQYYGSETVEDQFYIYLEYVHPGSINKYVRDHCGAITENVVRNFSRHILSGLAYLHSKKTIHRDIKGANLLVDACGVVKLADFGMSKHLNGPAAELSMKGSPYWMAPELMQAVIQKDSSSDLAFAVDIWSLGCTIIEMFTGKPPWSDYEGAAAMFKVLQDIPPIPESLSPDGKDFLRCCFRRNPADRPSATMLLEHRWLKNS